MFSSQRPIPMARSEVTVSPIGSAGGHPPNNSADFGPDTPGTSTQGLAEAIAAGIASGKEVHVLSGTFVVNSIVTIGGPCTLRFDGSILQQGPNNPGYCLDIAGAQDVLVLGTVRFVANPRATQVCVRWMRSTRVTWRAQTWVSQVPTGSTWMQAIDCSDGLLEGPFHSSDSALIHLTNSSHMIVRNVSCTYASDPKYNIIRADTMEGGTYSGILISEAYIDGGGLLDSTDNPYILVAAGAHPSAHPSDITISNCIVKNTKPSGTGPGGIVVLNVDRATVTNCVAVQMVFGFSFVGSYITCSNCIADHCWFPGFQVGDSLNQAYDWSDITLAGCLAYDCGANGDQDYVRAGISVQSTKGFTVRRITLAGCTSLDRGSKSQKFGLAVCDDRSAGVVREVNVLRCNLGGYLRPFYDGQSTPVGLALEHAGMSDSTQPAVVGVDDRTGLTSADPAPLGLYTVGPVDELLSVQAQVVADAYSEGQITYVATYVDAANRPRVSSVSVNQPIQREAANLIRCKARSNVKAQVTSAGTGNRFSVTCVVTKVRNAPPPVPAATVPT